MEAETKAALVERLTIEINGKIIRLEELIREYGSFNVIANAFVANQIGIAEGYEGDRPEKSPIVPEYLALVCLKFPYALGIGELVKAREVAKDFEEINDTARDIVQLYALLHQTRYDIFNDDGSINETEQMAASISAEELLVRNETFEEHHWERLEDLYRPHDAYFKEKLGFTIDEAIRICLTIQDHVNDNFRKGINGPMLHAQQMMKEVSAFKKDGSPTQNFYPPEMLEAFKSMGDEDLMNEFFGSMTTYAMTMMGHNLSFTAEQISENEDIDLETVNKFLAQFSIGFQEINPDFTMPEILHPLKDKPLLRHKNSYLCASLSLLDYALDRLFQKTLFADQKKANKYKLQRHDYLLDTGMKSLTDSLATQDFYTNLTYKDGDIDGELDGLIFCGNNAFFIEAKSHQITDRAKKGYIDRLLNHVEEIVEESHFQAKRTYQYLKGKPAAEFKRKNGSKVVIDGSKFQNAYFISLTLEGIKAISTHLKVGNTLGLFDAHTFPWIVSLYDLRVICEHMEGPAYLIQYMHRRREFFKVQKFHIQDELDLLFYYLERNLRFDELLEKHKDRDYLHLSSMSDVFNAYYAYEQNNELPKVDKLKHYTIPEIKVMVKALEKCGIANSMDAAVQLLELGTDTKNQLIDAVKMIKKRFKKDNLNHDFRMMGDNGFENSTWMLSYWVGPNKPEVIAYFLDTVQRQFAQEKPNEYFALYDVGKDQYLFKKIFYQTS